MKKGRIVFTIFVILLLTGYLIYGEGTLPVNKKSADPVIFTVEKGESLDSVINNLAKQDLIRNRLIFYLVVKQTGIERSIQAGDFELNPAMNAYQVADALTHATLDVWVTVPEGLRKEEIAEIMAKKFAVSETEFNELTTEGYLFPDTYRIPKGASAQEIIDMMRANFDSKYTADLQDSARRNGLNDTEVLILASILEKEAKYDEDRQKIASVLLRRYRDNYPLQVDATVQYALGYQASEKRWWKSKTSYADLEYDSPYNTYKYTGLPPAPISNPGIATMTAVVDADENTPYLFYVSDNAGHTYYSKTFAEHEAKIERYVR